MISTGTLDVEVTQSATPMTMVPTFRGGIELHFPVTIEFSRRQYSPPQGPQHLDVELQILPSRVRFFDQFLGRTHSSSATGSRLEGTDKGKASLHPVLSLSREDVHALENVRAGRAAEFSIDIQLRIGSQPPVGVHEFPITFRQAASDWADRLGEIGLFKSLHFTLPLSSRTDATANAHLAHELARADRLYRDGEYSACVAVIRDVWDPIVKELDTTGRWDPILDKALPIEIAAAVKSYAQELRALVNKGHHRGVAGPGGTALYEFTPHDAAFVMHAAVGFLRYLGTLARY